MRRPTSIRPSHAFPGAVLVGLMLSFMIAPVLVISGTKVPISQIILVVMATAGLLRITVRNEIGRPLLAFLLALTAAAIYLGAAFAIDQFRDDVIIKTIIWLYAIIFAAFWLASLYLDRYGTDFVDRMMWHVFVIGVIHAVIMIVAFLSFDFRDWLYQYVWLNEKGQNFITYNVRSPGLTSAGGTKLSVFQATTLVCGLAALSAIDKIGAIRLPSFLLGGLLILGSVVLSGRTGLVILALGLMMILLRRAGHTLGGSPLRFGRIAGVVTMVTVVGIVLWKSGIADYEKVIHRAFEFYFSWKETGRFATESTDVILHQMYFLPDTGWGLLFGTGNFGRSEDLPYIPSDVGYVRFLFGAGILGTLLAFSPYLTIGWNVVVHGTRASHTNLQTVVVFMLISLLLVNFKELLLVDHHGWTQLLLLLFCGHVLLRNSLRCEGTLAISTVSAPRSLTCRRP